MTMSMVTTTIMTTTTAMTIIMMTTMAMTILITIMSRRFRAAASPRYGCF
jgi:hypothetical protein